MKFALSLVVTLVLIIAVAADSTGSGVPQINWSQFQGEIDLYTNAQGVNFWSRSDEFISGEKIDNPCIQTGMLNKISVCHGAAGGDFVRSGCEKPLPKGSSDISERKVVLSACPKGYPKCANNERSDSKHKSYLAAQCCFEQAAEGPNCIPMTHDE